MHARKVTARVARWGGILLVGLGGGACSTSDDIRPGHEETPSTLRSALSGPRGDRTAASSSSRSALTLSWAVASSPVLRATADPVSLIVTNTTSAPIDAEIVLQEWGLHAHRTESLGAVHLSANGTSLVSWTPANAKIAPTRSVLRLVAQARYQAGTTRVVVPAPPRFGAYSSNFQQLALSHDGIEALAAASQVNIVGVGAQATHPSLGRKGRLDGVLYDDDAVPGAANGSASSTQTTPVLGPSWSPLDDDSGDVGETAPTSAVLSTATSAPANPANGPQSLGTTVKPCSYRYLGAILYEDYALAPVCTTWRPVGYRDARVDDASVPLETFNAYAGVASYANATVYRNGNVAWTGRTDASGCSPPLQFCPHSPGLAVSISSASFQTQDILYGGTLIPGSREIRISPAKSFSAAVSVSSSASTGATLANANVYASSEEEDRVLRVASVASHLLALVDSGVRDRSTSVPLLLHTEDGCPSADLTYVDSNGVTRHGEACAVSTSPDVYFGDSLSVSTGSNVPTGNHTTADVFTIAHEIGHAVAFDSNVKPPTLYDPPSVGICSCQHVTDGNRLHCMTSQMNLSTAFTEGWAHFYASRIMNAKASSARFTYYKDALKMTQFVLDGFPYYEPVSFAPPVPFQVGSPYADPSTNATGWGRTYCPSTNTATEYDWMTFLWATNGKPSSSQIDMLGLFSIFSAAPVSGSGFTWMNLALQADATFGFASPRAQTFRNAGNIHGVAQ